MTRAQAEVPDVLTENEKKLIQELKRLEALRGLASVAKRAPESAQKRRNNDGDRGSGRSSGPD